MAVHISSPQQFFILQVLGDVKRLWLRLCELQAASARPAVALGSPRKQRRPPAVESSDTDAVEEVPER